MEGLCTLKPGRLVLYNMKVAQTFFLMLAVVHQEGLIPSYR